MSGGHFDYKQYNLRDMSEEISNLIKNNDVVNKWGYKYNYSDKTIEEFKKAIEHLRLAEIYVQRIDWLVSGDDVEESFHERLKEELEG